MKKLFIVAFVFFLWGCETSEKVVPKEGVRPTWNLEWETYQPKMELTGTVEAQKNITVSSKVTGRIENIFVENGDRVQKGDVIARYVQENAQTQVSYQNALQSFDAVNQSMEQALFLAQTQLQNAHQEAQNVRQTQEENVRTQERLLETQGQYTDTIITDVLDMLTAYLHVSSYYQNANNALTSYVGRNDSIERQRLKNETENLLSTRTEGRDSEDQIEYLKNLQRVFADFDKLLKNSSVVSGFSESKKQSIQAQVTKLLQSLNAQVLEFERQIQALSIAKEQRNLQVVNAENRVRQAEKQVDVVRAQGESQTQNAQNQIALTQTMQKELELKSPFSGIITQKMVEEGQLVPMGTPVIALADVSGWTVQTTVPDVYVSRVQLGDRAEIRIDGYDTTFEGVVTEIDPKVDAQTRKLGIEITFQAKEQNIKMGLFARVSVFGKEQKGFFVPKNFIAHSFDGPSVLTQSGEKVPVQLGTHKESHQQILSPDVQSGMTLVLPE